MKMTPFERAKWCNNLKPVEKTSELSTILFSPLPGSQVEIIRNFIESKGLKLPSGSGYFHPPVARIEKDQTRKHKNITKTPLDVLLGISRIGDEQKSKLAGNFIRRGCILRFLGNQRNKDIPNILIKAAFYHVTLIFRSDITKALQNMGPSIILEFLPISQKYYNKERHYKKHMMSRYARYILNSSVSGNPRIALSGSTEELKLKLINLYSKFRVASAIVPLLNLAQNAPSNIQAAARNAIINYFKGNSRKTKVGTIKLPGGVEKKAVLYYNSRQQAYHAVKKALEEATSGDYDRTTSSIKLATQLFEAWDKLKKSKYNILFSKAYDKYTNGYIIEASKLYREILANGPNNRQKKLMFPAFMTLARNALRTGKVKETIDLLRILNQLDSNHNIRSDYYYLLGLSEEAKGDKVQAIYWYRMAIRTNHNHVWSIAALNSISPIPMVPVVDYERSVLIGFLCLSFLLGILYLLMRKGSDVKN